MPGCRLFLFTRVYSDCPAASKSEYIHIKICILNDYVFKWTPNTPQKHTTNRFYVLYIAKCFCQPISLLTTCRFRLLLAINSNIHVYVPKCQDWFSLMFRMKVNNDIDIRFHWSKFEYMFFALPLGIWWLNSYSKSTWKMEMTAIEFVCLLLAIPN